MVTKTGRFDFDWWILPKRYIYVVVAVLSCLMLLGGAGAYFWIYGNPFKGVSVDAGASAGARFDSFEGGVRVIRANTRETILARADTRLFPGDTVQTQEDGRARISLADGSTLLVKPNSTITIAENTGTENGVNSKVRVAVENGQINVRTERQPEGASNIVGTRLTENHLTSQTTASFDVREDKTEAIRVGEGEVETTTRNGDSTTLRNGEFASINQQGAIAQREKLLAAPGPTAPRNLEKISVRKGGATSVSLRWQRPSMGSPAHYRVEVATSPFFVAAGKVIERDQLQATEFTVDDIRQGNYFWRVRAMAPSGQASDWSEPQKFVVVAAGGTGESVTVSNTTVEYVAGNIYLVRGRTQAGNTVVCAGRETLAASDGLFQLQINVPQGAREIVVEAADTQGNKNSFRVPL
ncbi:MAG TPA: FecR domain-containing protein [Pyrinomonadaceae bacterium]|jgi:hypothetical protein|nr:FecR domain-containing protein [Pyrinomonadaceae bacterium]